MATTVEITNLTLRPIYVPLHSGENLRVQPGRTAGPVDPVELKGNARFEKLLSLRILAVEPSREGSKTQGDASATTGNDVSESAGEETVEGHGAQEIHVSGIGRDAELTGDADSPVEPRRA